MDATSKLLLVANHHLFRECLVNGLQSKVPVLVIDTAETYAEGIEQSRDTHYEIAVFDADPPAPFSPELTRGYKQEHDATHVVVMGRGCDEEQAVNFIQAGASDFRITDTDTLDDFCDAIKGLLEGKVDHRPERIRALFARLQKLSADVSRMKTIDAMVLTDHADLHPANLLVLPNNVVGYIDFGITGVLSTFSRHNLLATTLAFARNDIDSLCTAFFAVSSMDDKSNPDGFRAEMKRISDRWYHGSEEDSTLKTSASTVFMEMLTLSRKYSIWPQRDIIKYIRSAMAIDGLIRQFAPEFDVSGFLATSSKKYITRHARKELFSHDALISWSKATAQLSRDGAFRFANYLERFNSAREKAANDNGAHLRHPS